MSEQLRDLRELRVARSFPSRAHVGQVRLTSDRDEAANAPAFAGTPDHAREKTVIRFLYWATLFGGFFSSGPISMVLYAATFPLGMRVSTLDEEGLDCALPKDAQRHDFLNRAASVSMLVWNLKRALPF